MARGCLIGVVGLVAVGLVAVTVWVGGMALLRPVLGEASSTIAERVSGPEERQPIRLTPQAGRASPTPRPMTPAPATRQNEEELAQLDEAQLTEALRLALLSQTDGPSLDQPSVLLRDGRIEVQGRLTSLPIPVEVRIVSRVGVADGRPHVEVEQVEGVGMQLPPFVRDQVNTVLQRASVFELPEGVNVTRVEVGDGVVTVYGRRR